MTATLTSEQLRAIADARDEPVRLIDPDTNKAYVLIDADVFEQMRAALDDDFDIRDTYPAQFQSAMRAGWGDPAMDEYDNYDENYRKQCQQTEATSSSPSSPSAT